MIVSKLRSKLIKTALYRMRRSQYEQFLDLYVDGFRVIVCVFFFKRLAYIFVCFCVSLDRFVFLYNLR